ncbi:MAG: HD-GYP domain-containing protein [Deltaproteobacteria bacterium]|jgi:HD-GYP domain-containing protein (c-di-GMP phosphodiesterase class II)|nr:HD-GYP domain-containing protein [Deltaproteobacteria bacterium]
MLKKMPTRELKIGMFVADVGRAWFNHPWSSKSRLLTEEAEIRELIDYGIDEVYIDTEKSKVNKGPGQGASGRKPFVPVAGTAPPFRKASAPAAPPAAAARERVSGLEVELPKAAKAYGKALDTSKALIAACYMNKRIEVSEVQENVDELVESVTRNQDALSALIKLRRFDDYTYTHCLNVSVLSISTGKALGLSHEDLRILGMGTMFHDLGKTRVPAYILNKPGKLTDEEFAVMRNHSALSEEIILEQKLDVDAQVIQVARFHHERMDGSGYPDHLKGEEIPKLATICGLSDVYDALTSDRVYHKGMLPHDALKFIYGLRGTHFEPGWVDRFVQSVGIYPPGSVVEMNSGHIAVVMEVIHTSLLKPIVKIVADPKGRILSKPRVLHMASETEGEGWSISRVIPPSEAGFDPSYYFNLADVGK